MRMHSSDIQQGGWVSQTWYWVKEARCKKVDTVWFHLCEVQKREKLRYSVSSQNGGDLEKMGIGRR